jgi:hypothetical protein
MNFFPNKLYYFKAKSTAGLKVQPKMGDFVCFLGPNKKIRNYGVLAKDLTPIDVHGTYISYDPEDLVKHTSHEAFATVVRKDLHEAWLRCNNLDETSTYKKLVPIEELQTMWSLHLSDSTTLTKNIAISEASYASKVLEAAALRAATTKKPVQKVTKKSTNKSTSNQTSRCEEAHNSYRYEGRSILPIQRIV